VPHAVNPASDDPLLNSLCQFDILYCLLVLTEGQTSVKSMYPSSAAFDETRADPALVMVAGDGAVRATLFPNSTETEIAAAIYNVVRLTMQEAFKFGGRWWGPPPSVQAFLTANGQQEA
jgi:FAD/FMN-containing dehydrogenase